MERFGPEPEGFAGEAHVLAESLSQWLGSPAQESRVYDAAKVKGLIDTVQKRDKPVMPPDGTVPPSATWCPAAPIIGQGSRSRLEDAPLENELKRYSRNCIFLGASTVPVGSIRRSPWVTADRG